MEKRRENRAYLRRQLEPVSDRLLFPEELPGTRASWFGFLMTVREGLSRDALAKHLEAHNIQTRPLFAGNLTRHPCFTALREGTDYRVSGTLETSDRILRDSLWVGVYPGMEPAMLNEMAKRITEALNG